MTATPIASGSYSPLGVNKTLLTDLRRPLAASEKVGRGQFATISTSTGYAILNDGSTPNQVAGGVGSPQRELSDTSTTAAMALVQLDQRVATGLAMKASTDGFTDADISTPFYIADENTLGKLSHTGADGTLVNRSLGGLVFGLNPQTSLPYFLSGIVGWELARSALSNNGKVVARSEFALTANTTRAVKVLPRNGKDHGRITQIRIAVDAAYTSNDSNYWTIAINKQTSTTPGTPVALIATTTTKTTSGGGLGDLVALKYYDLTLASGTALDILEDDVLSIIVTTSGTSAAVTQMTVEVIGKVG